MLYLSMFCIYTLTVGNLKKVLKIGSNVVNFKLYEENHKYFVVVYAYNCFYYYVILINDLL